jgi:lipoprotein-releasing system permease protein
MISKSQDSGTESPARFVSVLRGSRLFLRLFFHLELVVRFVASGRRLFNLPSMMALIGMALGVASLTVAMAVVSGFESTLKSAIIDVFGHVMVVKRGEKSRDLSSLMASIKEVVPDVVAHAPFVNIEGLMVGGGKLSGILIQGLDPKTIDGVLNVRARVIEGEYSLAPRGNLPVALVGKALAKRFDLKVGEAFKVVLPAASESSSSGFLPKVQTYILAGVLDLGKAEYDEGTVMTDIRSAQELAGIGENFSGIRLKLKDADEAMAASVALSRHLGMQFWTMDWSEVNKNLFVAVKIERIAIFFVILIMVIAASFNIASNLFVSVLQRYGDISILRAMGFARRDVARVFMYQGLFFGVVGTLAGLLLGLLLSGLFVLAQNYVVLMPVEAYRLDRIGVELRAIDLVMIVVASIAVCLLSTLVPARRGARLDPVEGLRYE